MNTIRNITTILGLLAMLAVPTVATAEEPAPLTIPDCSNLPGEQTTAPPGLVPYAYFNGKMRPLLTQADIESAQRYSGFKVSCSVAGDGVEPTPASTLDLAALAASLPGGDLSIPLYRVIAVVGSERNDTIHPGYPALRGANDGITASGAAGDDRLYGGFGPNKLNGGTGNDTVLGGSATDRLVGGAGNDFLRGGRGAIDTYIAGPGNDRIWSWENRKRDVVNCGLGKNDRAFVDPRDVTVGCERVVVWDR